MMSKIENIIEDVKMQDCQNTFKFKILSTIYTYSILVTYMNLMITMKQKIIADTHPKMRKTFKSKTKDIHQITREESKRRKRTKIRTTKAIREQLANRQ